MNKYAFALFRLILLTTLSSPAYAYLDPGTGSLIIQGLIAGIAVVVMTIKMYWQKLVMMFHVYFSKKKPENNIDDKQHKKNSD